MNPTQSDSAVAFSKIRGENTNMNPLSLTSEEKLETQKGIRKSLTICQISGMDLPVGDETLSINAIPITPLIPSEVIQIRGVGSK